MEHRIRILNEHDRQSLVWLRRNVGDTRLLAAVDALAQGDRKPYISAVCRYLGVHAPVKSAPESRPQADTVVGDRYLARIRTQLAGRTQSQHR